MAFEVQFSITANEDLERLFDFIIQRELDSATGNLDIAESALKAIKDSLNFLKISPFTCRKVGSSPFLRELVIPFGGSGYVALFEIVNDRTIIIGAVRHQREDDYH